MRTVTELKDDWRCVRLEAKSLAEAEAVSPPRGPLISLPHTVMELPPTFGDHESSWGIYQYTRTLVLSAECSNNTTYLDFDGAMMAALVMVNGIRFPEHRGGYVPFSVDISSAIKPGTNELVVFVDTTERADIPPFGNRVDFLAMGGLYRQVYLRTVNPVHINDLFVRTDAVAAEGVLRATIELVNTTADTVIAESELTIADDDGTVIAVHRQPLAIAPGKSIFDMVLPVPSSSIRCWTLDSPKLYDARCTIKQGNLDQDLSHVRFGFRTAEFTKEGTFLLNGEPIFLLGLNRHQTFPWIGGAAPQRLQHYDADILKYELGCSIVRTSHYPQSPHFLNRCDEIGLLVFEEIPGWQHIGNDEWKTLVIRDVEAMIRRDRNHPSIVLWGVRVNESPDDSVLYAACNQRAHLLDPTRQTGGVRNMLSSEFLEDVFTFNDFSDGVLTPTHAPHLIAECSGHMFPTKTWDHAERRVAHALRYAHIVNKAKQTPGVAGVIGWCAFDYNTHREFGSGDRVCYHGVMDMYRQPKYAAFFFASQTPPSVRPVLHVASHWSVGDHNGGGVRPLIVFSNCEAIEVWIGEQRYGIFEPARDQYPALLHPPFVVEGITEVVQWEHEFGDLRVVGLMDGKPVITQQIEGGARPTRLLLSPSHPVLRADGADIGFIHIRVTDSYGNALPYADGVVQLSVRDKTGGEAGVCLIGSTQFTLPGGQRGILVRSTKRAGVALITATYETLSGQCVVATE